ncbi:hypothetical protein [Nocardia paucivorans]|uniref:hypothetical protein n=1 Tax=Nocardia paucivorans TaxID=114259 RepID=UPI0002E1D4F5|nr:hypothetical protein [Nocardia paucivorans]
MTENRTETTESPLRRMGILADGVVKVILAGAYTLGAVPLGHRLGVETWAMIVCGAALLVGGGFEIGYFRHRPLRTYTRLMTAYDSGWVLATLVGLLVVWRGGSAGGEVWIGYQTVAPLVTAALLVAAAPAQMTSNVSAGGSMP